MYTNKRFFKDKSIIALSVVSVMALSGLAASIMLSNMITMIPVFPRLRSWTKPAQNFRMLLQML